MSQAGGAMYVYVPGESASVELSILDLVIANCSVVGQTFAVRARCCFVWDEMARFATSMIPV